MFSVIFLKKNSMGETASCSHFELGHSALQNRNIDAFVSPRSLFCLSALFQFFSSTIPLLTSFCPGLLPILFSLYPCSLHSTDRCMTERTLEVRERRAHCLSSAWVFRCPNFSQRISQLGAKRKDQETFECSERVVGEKKISETGRGTRNGGWKWSQRKNIIILAVGEMKERKKFQSTRSYRQCQREEREILAMSNWLTQSYSLVIFSASSTLSSIFSFSLLDGAIMKLRFICKSLSYVIWPTWSNLPSKFDVAPKFKRQTKKTVVSYSVRKWAGQKKGPVKFGGR